MPHYEFFCKGCQKTFSDCLSAVRQQERRAALVCLLSSHIEEERVKPA